jgi:hypothetical protein
MGSRVAGEEESKAGRLPFFSEVVNRCENRKILTKGIGKVSRWRPLRKEDLRVVPQKLEGDCLLQPLTKGI